jgi:hypothetical protein
MESAHQPVSLAVHGRLSSQFRSYSRPADLCYKPQDRPLYVASVSPVEYLSTTHYPLLTTHFPLTTFRINTCKSVSKQRTLTPFRINTYKKQGGTPANSRYDSGHMRHVAPLSSVPHSIAHTSRHHGGVPFTQSALREGPLLSALQISPRLRQTQFRSSRWTFSAPPTTRYPLPATHFTG